MADRTVQWRKKPTKSSLFLLIVLNVLTLPVLPTAEEGVGRQVNNGTREEPPGVSSSPVLVESPDGNTLDGEVEIEDVEVDLEGAVGPSADASLEGSSNPGDEEVSGSGGQNGSDPTAVAKVYDSHVPNFVPEGAAEDPGGSKTPPITKPNRVKVACWDFRTMPVLVVNDSSPGSHNGSEGVNGTDPEGTEQRSEAQAQSVEAGPADRPEGPTSEEQEDSSTPGLEVISEGDEIYDDVEGTDLNVNRTVEIVNMTYLLHDVLYSNAALKLRSNPANCSVVMFYANWCPFSARAAPHFNALPRAYPPLRVAAIDSSKHKNVNTYFGILAVPTVVLFHNGKIIAKFNDTSFTLTKFAEFIEYFTDLKHEERINVTTKDFDGPLSSVPVKDRDWYLYLAWVFIIVCFVHYVTRTAIWRRAVDFVRTTWREAEAQHEHID